MRNRVTAAILLFLLCGFFGFLVTTQYQNYQAALSDLSNQSLSDLVLILQNLNDRRGDLTAKKEELSDGYNYLNRAYDSENSAIDALNQQRKTLTISAGTTAISGSGLSIVIEEKGTLSGNDLADLINELWVSGATAVSINDIRISGGSSFLSKGTKSGLRLYLNETELTFPLECKVLGDSNTLFAALNFPGGIAESLTASAEVTLEMEPRDELILPAAI